MSPTITASPIGREPALLGQTVVVIGGSAGIGLETARRARAEGAAIVLIGRDRERLQHAARELDAPSTAAFDAMDSALLARFFRDLPSQIDHAMVTAGAPHHGRLIDMDVAQAARRLVRAARAVSTSCAQCCRQDETGRLAAVHGRHRRAPAGHRSRCLIDGDCRTAGTHRQSCPRARAHPCQPDRRWLRRHAVVGIVARRSP